MIKIRSYRESDFSGVVELLKRNMFLEHLPEHLIREKLYTDPGWNPESALVALLDGGLAGFMMGVTRNIGGTLFGYIKLMAVEEQHRRRGIATAMYRSLEQYFSEEDVGAVRIYDVPLNYLVPGIDPRYTEAVCFAVKQGFVRNGEAVNMTVDLRFSDWKTEAEVKALKEKQVEIRRLKETDLPQLIQFIAAEWALWEFELTLAAQHTPSTVFIALSRKKIIAFAAYDGNNIGTGWFGPMGTDPGSRGLGLGRILLYKCLEEMKNRGVATATIPWVAPVGFYAHHANARISRIFWRFEKKGELGDMPAEWS